MSDDVVVDKRVALCGVDATAKNWVRTCAIVWCQRHGAETIRIIKKKQASKAQVRVTTSNMFCSARKNKTWLYPH